MSTFIFTSCSEDEDSATYKGDSLTYFTDGTSGTFFVEETENSTFKVPVGVTDAADTDRQFTVSIIEDETSATPDQYSAEQTFVIPANEFIGYIEVEGFFDNIPIEGTNVTFKLEEVQGSNIASFDNTYNLKLSQFCPFDIPLKYNGTAAIVGQGPVNSFEVELVPTGNLNEYSVDSIWGNFVAAATGDPSFEGDYQYAGTLSIDCLGDVTYLSTEASLPGGTGTLNEATSEITIVLDQELFTNPFQVEVVLTPML